MWMTGDRVNRQAGPDSEVVICLSLKGWRDVHHTCSGASVKVCATALQPRRAEPGL